MENKALKDLITSKIEDKEIREFIIELAQQVIKEDKEEIDSIIRNMAENINYLTSYIKTKDGYS